MSSAVARTSVSSPRRQSSTAPGRSQPSRAAARAPSATVRRSGTKGSYVPRPGSRDHGGVVVEHDPLCTIARWNRPAEAGEVRCAQTLRAPADSPNTVMLSGSAPKRAAFARTQRSAARWSARAKPGAPPSSGWPNRPKTPSR